MRRVFGWVSGIAGGIAAFLGVFILVGGADQWLGLGGDLTWRVGDISPAWGWGLFTLGLLLSVLALTLAMSESRRPTDRSLSAETAGLWTHVAVFLVVNAFLWTQDLVGGGGLDYAYWITIPWTVGILAHVVSYLMGPRPAQDARRAHLPRRELQRH